MIASQWPAVAIRLVVSPAEFAACEAMSRDIWGAAERNVVPRELLLTMQQNGGLVHGAFLPSGQMVGFCFGFPGIRDGRVRLCSHQLGVLPAYRGSGIGIALKNAQAHDARRLGYELISWTFDPLEARNAYINLHRLGCIARVYDRDHYGAMEDELNRGLPSDRFEAELWMTRRPRTTSTKDPTALLTVGDNDQPVRRPGALSDKGALIEVPREFQSIKRRSMDLALTWRMESRTAFEEALGAGLIAIDFSRTGAYIMERAEQ
ncbi:MAG: GNAT family N-acetyltransferase [Candidatus Dormibacteraeota bacterium]|nr:GNAT family N-acetyltransferase [Candidatus Dormibacteraeota bacterium]